MRIHLLSDRPERLEDRVVPASGGTVFVHGFADSNLNGQFDTFGPRATEFLIPDVRVFVDANENGGVFVG